MIAGHGFNYLLVLTGNRALSPSGFGRFYAGWAVLSVLVAPAIVLALLATQYYSELYKAHGDGAMATAFKALSRQLAMPIVVGVALTELALFVSGNISRESALLVPLLPVTAASYLAVEVARAAFPAMLRSLSFGIAWVLWCGLQYLCAAAGLIFIGTPWAAFAGLLLANVITLAALILAIGYLRGEAHRAVAIVTPGIKLARAVPFCTSYAGFVLLNYADVILAYRLLGESQLGAYSAAAVLAKVIIMATQPVVQVFLPVLIGAAENASAARQTVAKGIALTAGLAIVGVGFLWMLRGAVCGGQLGFRYCDPHLMLTLALAAAALAVVRVMITTELANGRYVAAHIPFAGVLVFLAVAVSWATTSERLAASYVGVSAAILVLIAVVSSLRAALANWSAVRHTSVP